MQKTIKKSVSMLLAVIMVFSLFTIVPFTAGAAVDDVLSEDDYLTFTAEADGATVTLNVSSGSNLQYNKNNSGWEDYTKGAQIDLENEGDYVRFSGTGTKFNSSNHFSITGKVACSGNVMSLRLDNDGKSQGLDLNCFRYMFSGCTGLTTAPDLPETDLKAGCYKLHEPYHSSRSSRDNAGGKLLQQYVYGLHEPDHSSRSSRDNAGGKLLQQYVYGLHEPDHSSRPPCYSAGDQLLSEYV